MINLGFMSTSIYSQSSYVQTAAVYLSIAVVKVNIYDICKKGIAFYLGWLLSIQQNLFVCASW
jgi:hypothetical protein